MESPAFCRALGILTALLSAGARSDCKDVYAQVQWKQALENLAHEPFLNPNDYVLPKSVSSMIGDEWIELGTSKLQSGGVNTTFLAVDAQRKPQAVVKVARSQQEVGKLDTLKRPEIEAGGLAKREVLAYRVDQDLLKFNLVPYTTLGRTSDGHLVTLQKFEDGVIGWANPTKAKVSRLDAQRKIAFDAIMGNYDRHPGNFLVTAEGKLILIDNGASMTRTGHANRAKADWTSHFPLRGGRVEDSLKQTLLNLDEKSLKELLDEFRIPRSAQQATFKRVREMKRILQSDSATIDDIANRLSPRSTDWGTPGQVRAGSRPAARFPAVKLALGGMGLTYVYMKIHEKSPDPKAASTDPESIEETPP